MSSHSSENYLDNLLNSMDGVKLNEAEAEQIIQEEFVDTMGSKTESDFLKEFESELESEAYNDYISDFENELESGQKEENQSVVEEEDIFKMADDDASLDDMLSHMESLSADGYEEDEVTQTMDTEDPMLGSLEDLDSAVGAFDTAMEESGLGEQTAESDLSEVNEPLLSEEKDAELSDILGVEEISESGEVEESVTAGEDVLDGLGGLDSLDELGNFDEVSEEEPEPDGKKKGKKEKKKKEKSEGGGFLEKLKLIFFGEDDEDDIDLDQVDVSNIDGLSDGDQQILKELGAEDGTTDKKGKKKEKKKKEKPKKEKPEKEKKEKPPKQPKPKKEKKPKEKDNTPPLPKVPVFMIWLMAGSMGLLVMLGTNLTSYSEGVTTAKSLYDTASYTEAYQKMAGLEIKEKDVELYQKVSTMASISSEYDSYLRYMTYGRKDLALDSLICAAGRCELNRENAVEYGCEEDLDALEKKIKKTLKKKFKISLKEALEFYAIDDRNEYTIALKDKIVELGINED